jgi:predicted type IV restriction endonuclease
MKEVIKDIQTKLQKDLYKNEQHVRFALVGRICQALGWEIWNPAIFDTENPSEKLEKNADGKQPIGKVDIALYKLSKNSRIAHIFIEVKNVGVLSKDIQKSRDQLENYSLKINPPLSVLTDGRKWELYLNCLKTTKGKYVERLINSVDLVDNDTDQICSLFTKIMGEKVSKTSLESLGKRMRKEFEIIQYIQEVKQQALLQHPGDEILQTYAALDMIKKIHKISISHKRISELWKELIALGGSERVKIDVTAKLGFSEGVCIDDQESYTNKTISEISLKGNVLVINGLADLKRQVFNFIINKIPGFSPSSKASTYKIYPSPDGMRKPIELNDGRFTEGWLSADAAVKQCKKALEAAGISTNDLIIGYTISNREKTII